MTRRRKQGGGKRRSAVGAADPQRSCVACRATRPKEELLRFVRAPDGAVFLDVEARLPGRGAWVCAASTCVMRAVERGGFARAFEAAVLPPADVVGLATGVLEAESLRGLGLLRRQQRLWPGRTEALRASLAGESCCLIVARDLAARSVREVSAELPETAELVVGPDKAAMGVALGRGPTGVVALGIGPLAMRVKQYLQRLAALSGAVLPESSAAMVACESTVAGV